LNKIEVRGVWKEYPVRKRRRILAVDVLRLLTFRSLPEEAAYALRNVSFDVAEGETYGIVGGNGAGKSTLLRILTGVTVPSRGEVRVRGSVSALLELGAGFHSELTGRENIWLSAAMMGLARRQIRGKLDEIVSFAELESFIDQPVFTYSSGMLVRLGFSIALALDPEVLILDEVLAVGDHVFRAKSYEAIRRFRDAGKTVVLVSHDLQQVATFCDRALLLNGGAPVLIDDAAKVVPFYMETAGPKEGLCFTRTGRLGVAFNNGRILLYVGAAPITQAMGLYLSLFASMTWFDSNQASWRMESIGPHAFEATGTFRSLPLVLSVRVEVRSEKELRVTMTGRVLERMKVEQYHASLLVQSTYERWAAPPEAGEFPDIGVASNEWVHVNRAPLRGRRLEASGDARVPSVAVVVDSDDFTPTALNTDHRENARVLQFLRKGGVEWSPGVHEFFAGTVEIGD
jgi:ABC-type polysaccharide/polyol phosphate transport system ATPase subunit